MDEADGGGACRVEDKALSSTRALACPVGGSGGSIGWWIIIDGAVAVCMILKRADGALVFAAYCVLFNSDDALEADIHALMQGMGLTVQHTTYWSLSSQILLRL